MKKYRDECAISAFKCCPERSDSGFRIMIWKVGGDSGENFYFEREELERFGVELIQLAES